MTAGKAKSLVGNKKELWEALVRNQVYVPSFKSQGITEGWLLDAYEGDVFVLQTHQLRYRNCLTPPNKLDLFRAVKEALPS
jgi:hypothetical protein